MTDARPPDSPSCRNQMRTMTVESLEQARLLTDPFKLRLIEAFADGPHTTKQVADLLGENPTKLYRHVDALERAGLLMLVEERKKRGTVERYLQTVACRFEVDPMLFDPSERQTERKRMIGALLNDVRRELEESPDAREAGQGGGRGGGGGGGGFVPLLARLAGRAPPAKIASLRRKLEEWIEESGELEGGEKGEPFGVLIAFYPRPPEPPAS